jgi:hypothetical protein
MNIVRFGGPLGAMPGMGITVHPCCQGEASLPDDARAELVQAAPNCILKHMKEQLARWYATSHKTSGQMVVEVGAAVATAVSAELGVNVRMGSVSIELGDEDKAALQARAKEGRMAIIAKQQAQEAAVAAAEDPKNYYGPSEKVVRFYGALGAMLGTGTTVHPHCSGHASLPSDARDDIVQAAPIHILQHVKQQTEAVQWFADRPDPRPIEERMVALRAAISAAAGAQLGVAVNVGLLKMDLSEQDYAEQAERMASKTAATPQAAAPSGGTPAAPAAAVAGPPATKKKSGALFAIIGGALVVVVVASGLVWHFTHSSAAAPAAAHEHARGKR